MPTSGGMFWSGDTLSKRLGELIEPFDPTLIDCASYKLSIGPEVYVSPSDQAVDPTKVTVRKLANGEGFTIPPGQFAFLITEETITVPGDALALVSMRAKTKFRGLVNVSGFHVDPGYHGQFTFAVFNAGPVTIHLKRGQPIFLIWYANLDSDSEFKKNDRARMGLDPEIITAISGELQSFAGISKKIRDVDRDLGSRIHSLEREQTYYRVIGAIALAAAVFLFTNWLKGEFDYKEPGATSAPAQSMLVPNTHASAAPQNPNIPKPIPSPASPASKK